MAIGFIQTLSVAFKSLRKNKLRACLTVLGVVMGIASVTTMVSIGEGTKILVQGEFEKFGTNVVAVLPKSRMQSGAQQGKTVSLTAADSAAIARECPSILAASPVVTAQVQLIYRNVNWRPDDVYGVGTDFLFVRNWRLRRGGFFTQHEITSAAKVCVIGDSIVKKLFQTTNPLHEAIRINNIPFRIVGVLDKKGVDIDGNDDDDVVVIPHTTVRKRLKGSEFSDVNYILASARSIERMSVAEREIDRLLRERHRIHAGSAPDYVIQNSAESLQQIRSITWVMTLVLTAIAAISLLVGGIGIMNIMLVSVTERTREIGIRMAVGARPRDIRRQFIAESVVLSCLGGFAGIALGFLATGGVTYAINTYALRLHLPLVVSLLATGVAMTFAAAVGVFFGYFPARQASRFDPIEALRYE